MTVENLPGSSFSSAELLVPASEHPGRYFVPTPRMPLGTGGIAHFVTPGGGIAARSGATLGSATCTLLSIADGTRSTTATTATVYNNFTSAVGGSVDIVAAKIDGVWSVIAEDCA